jgi:hypothetical protein
MSGIDDVLVPPTLLRSLRNVAPSLDNGNGGAPMDAGWRIEALAWIPFGVISMILLTRTESQASRATSELGNLRPRKKRSHERPAAVQRLPN